MWNFLLLVAVFSGILACVYVVRENIRRMKLRKWNLAVSNRAHERHITLGEAEQSLLSDGIRPPVK